MTSKKEKKEPENDTNFHPYMPGTEDVIKEILKFEAIKTVKETDTDKEPLYLYIKPIINKFTNELTNPENAGIFVRGEDEIKQISERTKLKIIKEMLQKCKELADEDNDQLEYALNRKLIHDGITNHEVQEIMQNIRRKTFVDRATMNPDGYIPLKTGLLSLKDWTMQEFTASKFFTWKVRGTYDPSVTSLNQTPLFFKFLNESYPDNSIQTLLDYMAYSLYPSFPRQKVLVIVGPPRIGKGTIANLMQKILNEGFGRISLMKLLIPDNKFSLQGIEGKRLLVDTEIKREFKKNTDFDVVNSLFGGDPLPLERKYHQEFTYISKSAGLLIGNLPLFRVNNTAFLSRLLIITTREKREFKEVPNMAELIFDGEGDLIVSLLLNRLRSLILRDFEFSNELTNDEYAELWELLSDSTQAFVEEGLIDSKTNSKVDDIYNFYVEDYCKGKGIPPESKHVFVSRVGKVYPKKQVKKDGKRVYAFTGCSILTEVEIQREQEHIQEVNQKVDKFSKENFPEYNQQDDPT